MFIKNFKLFAICVVCLNMYAQARSVSNTQIGDVTISRSDNEWICDRIECPLDAFRCFVSKSNENDPAILVRVNTCYSKDNRILVNKVFESPADPNSRIKVQVTSTRNGNIISSNNGLEDFDEEKFNAHMEEKMKKLQAHLKHQLKGINEGINNRMEDLHENLREMNENIQSNLHNQMKNLKHNLSNMRYNLDHMFD